jgi:hypothetical protein
VLENTSNQNTGRVPYDEFAYKPDSFPLQVLATLQLVLLAALYVSPQWDLLQEKLRSCGELHLHSEQQ